MFELPILETERLVLRPAQLGDLDWLYEVWCNPLVRKHLWQGREISREDAASTLDTCIRHGLIHGLGLWLIHLPEGRRVGFFGFWPRSEERSPDILMGLLPSEWGKGYAQETACSLFAYAFDRNLADEIICSVSAGNHASMRVAERLNMTLLHELGGQAGRTRFYRLTPEQFRDGLCAETGMVLA